VSDPTSAVRDDGRDGSSTPRVVLRVENLSKNFAGTKALSNVDFDVRAGEVHALVGHNGSGKSTLIKVLSGYHTADPGAQAYLDGEAVEFAAIGHGRHGQAARVSFVHQDLGLVLELNAIDNLALHGGFTQSRMGRIKWRQQARTAKRLMAPFARDFDINKPLSQATPVERTIVAIAGALQGWESGAGGVLVLDEPTAVLPPGEVGRLFKIVRDLRASGAGIIYVSHRLDEIFELADRVTVLRNGVKVATSPVKGMTKNQLVHQMLGVEMEPDYRAPVPENLSNRPALQVQNLCGRYLRGTTFTLLQGEVLGVAGLPDSGRDELPRLLTDQSRYAVTGKVRLGNALWTEITDWNPRRVALLPPDRGREGIVGPMSVAENLSLSVLHQFGPPVRFNHRHERRFVGTWIGKLGVKTASPASGILTLSGGNQQKVLFGRVLAREPEVLVLCEPTAGVDIGARHQIYDLVAAQVNTGLSVLITSSDVGDLVALCTRVLVLHAGVVGAELSGDQLTEHQLVAAMEGLESEAAV
jgi:ribose transport system ATP-binding protein